MEAQGPEEYVRKPSVFLGFPVHLAKGDLLWMGFALGCLRYCLADHLRACCCSVRTGAGVLLGAQQRAAVWRGQCIYSFTS